MTNVINFKDLNQEEVFVFECMTCENTTYNILNYKQQTHIVCSDCGQEINVEEIGY